VPAGTSRGRRQYSASERAELLVAWQQSGLTAEDFARRWGMASHSVLYSWRHASRTGRALAAPDRPRNPTGKTRPPYAEAERVAAVSAYRSSGLTQRTFARVWGLSIKTLSAWLTRVAREGDKGLAPRKPGRRKGSVSASGLSPRVQQEIVSVRERFPDFGLKKLSQYLRRFTGLKVAPATVGRTLERAGVPRAAVPPRNRPPAGRRRAVVAGQHAAGTQREWACRARRSGARRGQSADAASGRGPADGWAGRGAAAAGPAEPSRRAAAGVVHG
jgi:transposase